MTLLLPESPPPSSVDSGGFSVRCLDLLKSYQIPDAPPQIVLSGLDLTIAPGEWVVLMGDSGSGKSTFLNLLAGIDTADGGILEIDGTPWHAMDDAARTKFRRKNMGFIFQFYNLFHTLTVLENVLLSEKLAGTARPGETRSRDLIAAVGLSGKEKKYPGALSGGEQQRVAIARALVHRPRLLLADEPTASLDHETGKKILELMTGLRGLYSPSIVMTTHSREVARSGDRIVFLRDGRVLNHAHRSPDVPDRPRT